MPYSQSLADRVRDVFAGRRGITEKTMFGGIAFLLSGNMCVGVWQTSLIIRILDAVSLAIVPQDRGIPLE